MDTEVKKFIEENADLIEENNFEQFYKKLETERRFLGQFTEVFLNADIDPAKYMNEIPSYYLSGTKIASYTIPQNITSMAEYVFLNCENLTDMVIPGNVKAVGKGAFFGCENLKSVIVEEGVAEIDDYAFQLCKGLQNITLPNSVTFIGRMAVEGCSKLTTINYLGTKKQWRSIKKKSDWKVDTPLEKVKCTDGVIKYSNRNA